MGNIQLKQDFNQFPDVFSDVSRFELSPAAASVQDVDGEVTSCRKRLQRTIKGNIRVIRSESDELWFREFPTFNTEMILSSFLWFYSDCFLSGSDFLRAFIRI